MTGATTSRVLRATAGAMTAALALAALATSASAGHVSLTLNKASEVATFEYYGGCTASAVVETREIGDSGISRIAVEFQLRGPNDPYLPGLAYRYIGWWFSPEIPLDQRTHWWRTLLPPGYMNFSSGSEYAVWAKAVGERDSFWRRDLVQKLKLGTAGCQAFDPTIETIPNTYAELWNAIGLIPRQTRLGGG